jgi:hypothetical protein
LLHEAYVDKVLSCKPPRPDLKALYQSTVLSMLETGNYAPEMGPRLARMAPLDLQAISTKGSLDNRMARALITIVIRHPGFDTAAAASWRLYEAMHVRSPAGSNDCYLYCAEIYDAILTRKARDKASGLISPVDKTILNMHHHGRSTLAEIKKHYPGATIKSVTLAQVSLKMQ